MQDCLLLQHLMWQAPNEAERIAEWLLAQLAEGGDVRQCDYLLNSASLAGNLAIANPARLHRDKTAS